MLKERLRAEMDLERALTGEEDGAGATRSFGLSFEGNNDPSDANINLSGVSSIAAPSSPFLRNAKFIAHRSGSVEFRIGGESQ